MSFLNTFAGYAIAIREFIAPTYRPERHYMRGPGPACARRVHAAIETRTVIKAQVSFQ